MYRLKTTQNLLILSILVAIFAVACSGQIATETEEVQTNSSEPASPTAESTTAPEPTGQTESSDSPSESGSLDELYFNRSSYTAYCISNKLRTSFGNC